MTSKHDPSRPQQADSTAVSRPSEAEDSSFSTAGPVGEKVAPGEPCRLCGGRVIWKRDADVYRCEVCGASPIEARRAIHNAGNVGAVCPICHKADCAWFLFPQPTVTAADHPAADPMPSYVCPRCGHSHLHAGGAREDFFLEFFCEDLREAVTLDAGERHLVTLALAEIALSRPGFEDYARKIAQLLSNGQVFDEFKRMNADRVKASHGPFGFDPDPQPHQTLTDAVQLAAWDLPDGFEITLTFEFGSGSVELNDTMSDFSYAPDASGMTLSEQVLNCLAKAKEEAGKVPRRS